VVLPLTAPALLATLGRLKLSAVVDGDSLRVTGPRSAMTPNLEQAIRDHKAELVDLVAADSWPLAALSRSFPSERV
jgi:TubC N-terminal docking domain